jgi:coenzyme PQQ biosynthesis protein PqqD
VSDPAPVRLAPAALRRTDPVDGHPMIVLPERAVRLNATGDEILSLCDGTRSAPEIAAELRTRHPDAGDVEADVRAFLADMEALGVIERPRP